MAGLLVSSAVAVIDDAVACNSVEAEATPIGRYKKAVADAIGSRWYYYVDEKQVMDVI